MPGTFISRVLGKTSTAFVCVFSISLAVESLAQGQDTTPWSRDLQVIEVMLPGLYSNANQAYFDGRRQVSSPVGDDPTLWRRSVPLDQPYLRG